MIEKSGTKQVPNFVTSNYYGLHKNKIK